MNKDKDYDKILSESEKMNNDVKKFLVVSHTEREKNEFFESLQSRYSLLYNENMSITKMITSGNMDMDKLRYMISMAKKIQDNKISEQNASVEVGKELFKEYIEPNIKNN